ncbi:hypothetical protein DX928_02985 [Bacillus swezeyi]|uniref:Uncharacterized protein n=1 Tax=Bacillus swezeyi TaxID=1925020 RepID=A0A5M8RVN3_9BACI|nr:hypothetical protein DX927_11300 [Bacillus swezeyi]KAA6482093.1 hypothetical protein DX928_02985 [Bacillus swezeyi]
MLSGILEGSEMPQRVSRQAGLRLRADPKGGPGKSFEHFPNSRLCGIMNKRASLLRGWLKIVFFKIDFPFKLLRVSREVYFFFSQGFRYSRQPKDTLQRILTDDLFLRF